MPANGILKIVETKDFSRTGQTCFWVRVELSQVMPLPYPQKSGKRETHGP